MSAELPICCATGAAVGGPCYRVLLWEQGALPPEAWAAWQQQRGELLAAMRDAGIRGARGRLAALESELRELAARLIASPLTTQPCRRLSYARAEELAQRLSDSPEVLGYRLSAGGAEIFLSLGGGEGVAALCERWCADGAEPAWQLPGLVESLSPGAALSAQAALSAESARKRAEAAAEQTAAAQTAPFHHVTVLRREAVELLQPAEGKVFVDATLGGGGHSELLLQAGASVWGIDQDPAARQAAARRLAPYGERLHIVAGNFRDIAALMRAEGVERVDGLLADIGISSPQVDCAERGFSFLQDGPLDMRMNPAAERSAATLVNELPEDELADILWQYGEEKASRALARRIVAARAQSPITTTGQLAALIAEVLPRKGRNHPATRSFQALRIAVNDELGALDALLRDGLSLLKSGGRMAIITFHSLEDRAVKRAFERLTRPEIDRPEWPAPRPNPEYAARLITRKPLTPTADELAANPRARSAKLRVIEKR